jgi:hypothetical protein
MMLTMLFIYLLFIRHDGMQPGGYGPLEKQMKCSERERANNPEVMPSSPMNKCKMQKRGTVVFSAENSKSNTLLHNAPSPVL